MTAHSFRSIVLALVCISVCAVPLLAYAQPTLSETVNIQSAPASNKPITCGAPAIRCADGKIIEPGPDCRYHDSCAPAGTGGGGTSGGSKGISCGAPAIKCPSGKVIQPGSDCRYHDSCDVPPLGGGGTTGISGKSLPGYGATPAFKAIESGGIVGASVDAYLGIPTTANDSDTVTSSTIFSSWYSRILESLSGAEGTIFNTFPNRVRCPVDVNICPDGTLVSRTGPNCSFNCLGREIPPGKERGYICPQDAVRCPDGTYVGRTGPNCSFVCPIATTSTPIKPISCGAPAIQCPNGKVIQPGSDCRYHDSCDVPPLEGGGVGDVSGISIPPLSEPSTFPSTIDESFIAFPAPSTATSPTFGSRMGSIFSKLFAIPAWLSERLR